MLIFEKKLKINIYYNKKNYICVWSWDVQKKLSRLFQKILGNLEHLLTPAITFVKKKKIRLFNKKISAILVLINYGSQSNEVNSSAVKITILKHFFSSLLY